MAQGGSGVVVYRVGATAVRDGVSAGAWCFPGAPLPGGGRRSASRSSACRGTSRTTAQLRVVAEDDAGNAAEVAFVDRFVPKPPPATGSSSTTPS